jgi:hypothetical protein
MEIEPIAEQEDRAVQNLGSNEKGTLMLETYRVITTHRSKQQPHIIDNMEGNFPKEKERDSEEKKGQSSIDIRADESPTRVYGVDQDIKKSNAAFP